MEFIAKIPDNLPEIIENNSEELKVWLTEKMEHYNGIVVTKDSIQEAKNDKAALNKLLNAMEERRKEVKRDYLTPYMRFEQKYKELTELIKAPIDSIDSQIRAFDDAEKSEKYERLKAYFQQCMENAPEGRPQIEFDRILNPKWANKSLKEQKLEQEICDSVTRISGEYEELRKLYAENENLTAILFCYSQGYDKAAALAYAERLRLKALADEELAKKALQDAQARAEFNARRETAMTALGESEQVQQENKSPSQTPSQNVSESVSEGITENPKDTKIYTCTFKAAGTREQLRSARDYMLEIGLKLG